MLRQTVCGFPKFNLFSNFSPLCGISWIHFAPLLLLLLLDVRRDFLSKLCTQDWILSPYYTATVHTTYPHPYRYVLLPQSLLRNRFNHSSISKLTLLRLLSEEDRPFLQQEWHTASKIMYSKI